MTQINARAPGKIILFGEHAVVYGKSALAMAIDFGIQCNIKEITPSNLKIVSHPEIRLKWFNEPHEYILTPELQDPSQLPPKILPFFHGLTCLQKSGKIRRQSIIIELHGPLWYGVGLGSSASSAVAFLWALNGFYDLGLSKTRINQFAFDMEKYVHKSPSGIDNSTAVFGHGIYFRDKIPEEFHFHNDLPLLIVHSGKTHDTGQAIQKVQNFRDNDPQTMEDMWNAIEKITQAAIQAINRDDLLKVGQLMIQNQAILRRLGLSTSTIDSIIQYALDHHAFGAKLTGAGLGGCVIILAPKDQLQRLSQDFSRQGYANRIIQKDIQGVCYG